MTENRRRDVEECQEKRCIGDEAKAAGKYLVAQELSRFVEDSLKSILCTLYHNTQSGICLVVYSVVEKVMLDRLRNSVIGETLDTHIAIFFDTDAGTDRLSKELLASSSFITPMATFIRLETNNSIADQNTVMAMTSVMESVAAVEAYGSIVDESPS